MKVLQGFIYSTIAFVFFVMVTVNFFDILMPIPPKEIRTVQKIDETIYYFTPRNDIVTSKFYNDDGYFLVIYNEDSKDFNIKEVEEEDWKHQEINRYEI